LRKDKLLYYVEIEALLVEMSRYRIKKKN